MKRRDPEPVLITDAEPSQDDQLRRRQIRYVLMMGLRVLCLVLAGVLVTLRVPALWLWLVLCGLGMVLLPWFAVILANDRPPREEYRLRRYTRPGPSSRALPEPRPERRVIEAQRVIDAEP